MAERRLFGTFWDSWREKSQGSTRRASQCRPLIVRLVLDTDIVIAALPSTRPSLTYGCACSKRLLAAYCGWWPATHPFKTIFAVRRRRLSFP